MCALHPSLRRALGVLDARLEDELVRYRRYRAGLRVAPSAVTALKRSMPAPALQLPTPQLIAADLSSPPLTNELIVGDGLAVDEPDIAVDADEDITVDQTPRPAALATGRCRRYRPAHHCPFRIICQPMLRQRW
ncbi:MAG: hypothetical protein HC805_02520 [Alkalinema sp. RL_2_19]|nr:hypothetical protein [Alkalinema sp. RL_2_19]